MHIHSCILITTVVVSYQLTNTYIKIDQLDLNDSINMIKFIILLIYLFIMFIILYWIYINIRIGIGMGNF